MTAEEGSSHLDGAGAQRQGGPDTFAIDYATGGDDGQLYRRDYLWQQGKGTLLQGEIPIEEMAAMAARLQPLRYDGIGAMAGQPFRFCYRGCTGKYFCCLLYTSPSPRDRTRSRMPSSA